MLKDIYKFQDGRIYTIADDLVSPINVFHALQGATNQAIENSDKITELEKDFNLFLEFYVDQSDDCHERVLQDFEDWKSLDSSLDGDKGLVQ